MHLSIDLLVSVNDITDRLPVYSIEGGLIINFIVKVKDVPADKIELLKDLA